MRTIYVVDEYPVTTETFVYREISALRRAGHKVTVFALRRSLVEGPSDDYDVLPSTRSAWRLVLTALREFSHCPRRAFKLVRRAIVDTPSAQLTRQLFAVLKAAELNQFLRRRGEFAVHLHAHFAARCADVAFLSTILRDDTFYTVTAHASDIYAPDDLKLLERRLVGARAVITVSQHGVQRLWDLGIRVNCHQVIRCGVDIAELESLAGNRSDAGHPAVELITVGRFVEKKGWDTVIDIAAVLSKKSVAFRWTCVGDGPIRARITRKTADAGLMPFISYTGALENAETLRLIGRADVLVLPCQRSTNGDLDGIPVVLMEAMALRVPVVASSVAGISELVKHRVTGMLVAERNAGETAEAIIEVISNPELRAELVTRAREMVFRSFNSEVEARKLLAIFETVRS